MKRKSQLTLSREDLKSYSFEEDDTDTYAGCKISFWDPYLEKKIEMTFMAKREVAIKEEHKDIIH